MCNRFDALEIVEKICSSRLRLFWIVKPNTLWERTVSSAWPSIDKSYNWGDSLRMQTRSSLHFLTLSLNQLSVAHTWTDLRVDWVVEKLSLDRFSEVETSSTYFHILLLGETILKLLTIIRNRIGPSLVPWGHQHSQKASLKLIRHTWHAVSGRRESWWSKVSENVWLLNRPVFRLVHYNQYGRMLSKNPGSKYGDVYHGNQDGKARCGACPRGNRL